MQTPRAKTPKAALESNHPRESDLALERPRSTTGEVGELVKDMAPTSTATLPRSSLDYTEGCSPDTRLPPPIFERQPFSMVCRR
jgi:hypothetical protein